MPVFYVIHIVYVFRINIIYIYIIITIAQQPYMGSGLLFPRFLTVGDWPTGRDAVLSILM
jgi:hypothetical protein